MEQPFDKRKKAKIWAVILIGSGIIALGFGFGGYIVVEPNEYVIVQDWYTREIDPQIYETGRYWVGYGKIAIIFPKDVQRLVFDTISGSDDLPITIDAPISAKLDAIFLYKINKSAILNIYQDYKGYAGFKDAMLYRIWAIVSESMSGINYEQLYFNRSVVNQAIFQGLKADFQEQGVISMSFQITEVEFPKVVQESFELLQKAIIDQKVAMEQQKTAVIRAQTLIMDAQAKANVSRIQATINAETMLIEAKAMAEQLNMTMTMNAYTLGLLMNATYIDDAGQTVKVFNCTVDLLTYLWIQAVMQHDSAYLIIGENTPILPIITNSTHN